MFSSARRRITSSVLSVVGAEPGVAEPVGLDQDMDLLLEPAPNPHRGHTLDRFEGTLDLELGQTPKPAQPLVALELDPFAGQAQFEHRIKSRVESQDQRPFGLDGEENEIELLQGVLDGLGHLDPPAELEHHVGHPGAADGRDPTQPADHTERLFDGSADVVLDLLRGSARVLGANRQRRVAELGHERDRQPKKGEKAENHGGEENHQDRHRSIHQERSLGNHRRWGLALGDHDSASSSSSSSGTGSPGRRTSAPSLRLACPATTI
jgi:hypothetical protein